MFLWQGVWTLFFLLYSLKLLAQPATERQKALANDSIGKVYSLKHDNKTALEYYFKALNQAKSLHDTALLIKLNEQISYSLIQIKEYKKAIPYQLRASELKNQKLRQTPGIYYKKVVKLYQGPADTLNTIRLLYRFGLFLDKLEKKKESADYFVQALKLAKTLRYDKAIATIANDLAGEYWDLGLTRLSTLQYQEALEASQRINDSNRIASIYLNLGDNYKDFGDLEKGMQYFIKALKIKESIKNTSRLCFFYIKGAEIAKAALNEKKWKEYIYKAYALKDNEEYAIPMEKAIVYQHLSDLAESEGKLDLAFKYYDTLAMISHKIQYLNGMRVALTGKAGLYEKMGKPEKALELFNEAEQYISENPYYQIAGKNQRAELYMKTGDLRKALKLLKANINNPALSNYANHKLITLQLLYKVNTELANYQEAFRWNDSLRNFENKLRDENVRKEIAALETKYETEKNRHTISTLKVKNQYYSQQIRFAVLMIVLLIVVLLMISYLWRMNKLKSEFRENQLKESLLRSQMNPHFIFNALNSIQQLILKNDNQAASFYLSRFSSIARIILEYSAKESIPLDKEIEVLRSYIEIERLRSGNGFNYEILIEEKLEPEFIEIPPMAVQPFVENAIKHGLKEKKNNGHLTLSFKEENDIIVVTVEDNGVGIKNSKKDNRRSHKSMAMSIFETRRQLLQKRYKKKLDITFVDLSSENKEGTRVIIRLPIL